MKVFCIEGCHGCGKTEIISELKKLGYTVFDEGFLDMPELGLNPQSFTMELIWVCEWIKRVLKTYKESVSKKKPYFADRSPFSALFYAPNGTLMENVLRETIKDMLAGAGINIKSIYVRVESDILWERITSRLQREPHRVQYKEDSRDWMNTTVAFYESHTHLWNYVVQNDSPQIADVVNKIVMIDT
jgi:thymidylate kinase